MYGWRCCPNIAAIKVALSPMYRNKDPCFHTAIHLRLVSCCEVLQLQHWESFRGIILISSLNWILQYSSPWLKAKIPVVTMSYLTKLFCKKPAVVNLNFKKQQKPSNKMLHSIQSALVITLYNSTSVFKASWNTFTESITHCEQKPGQLHETVISLLQPQVSDWGTLQSVGLLLYGRRF